MSSCCVKWCGKNSRTSNLKKDGITFHRFPKCPDRKSTWINTTYRGDGWFPSNNSVICSRHFTEDSFHYMKDRRRVMETAVPTLHLPILKDVPVDNNASQTQAADLGSNCSTSSTGATHFTIKYEVDEGEDEEEDNTGASTSWYAPFSVRGLVPPVFTPMNEDGSINFTLIPSYAKYLADSGIKAVLVGGTTGENMSLRVVDRMKLVEVWVEAASDTGLHIMVQVGGAPLADVLVLTRYCEKAGAHSLLTLPELYFKPQTVDELVSYVALVANAAPSLPVLYYHIPSMSKVEINMPQFVTAATKRIPNFKGIKFTSNDLSEAAQVLRSLEEGQEIFLGADTLIAPAALLGIKSSIGTTFNLFPALAQQILQAVENNEVARARELQEKLSLAIEAHTCEGPWVPIMKAGMELLTGIKVGPPSLPQQPISAEAKARIAQKLSALGVAEFVWFYTNPMEN